VRRVGRDGLIPASSEPRESPKSVSHNEVSAIALPHPSDTTSAAMPACPYVGRVRSPSLSRVTNQWATGAPTPRSAVASSTRSESRFASRLKPGWRRGRSSAYSARSFSPQVPAPFLAPCEQPSCLYRRSVCSDRFSPESRSDPSVGQCFGSRSESEP
jgi:hypothetical protein